MFRAWIKWIALTAIFLLVFSAFSLSAWFYYTIKQPMTVGNQPVIFEVRAHESAYSIAVRLAHSHWIKSQRALLFYIRMNDLAHSLKAGIYEIGINETAPSFLHRIEKGDILKLNFRVPEGANYLEVSRRLKEAPYLKFQETDWSLIQNNHPSPEGLLLADTYQYEAGSDVSFIFRQAHQNLMMFLEEVYQNRAPNLPYHSPYELLIAASIVEKEAGVPFERRLIAGVVVNRLNKNMPLQMDPTVIYGLGTSFHERLRRADLKFDTPYNTYLHRGLPPTPIAMVGKDALLATAHPLMSDYLYYVAKGDGTHAFSKTYLEQRQAIHRYIHKGAQH